MTRTVYAVLLYVIDGFFLIKFASTSSQAKKRNSVKTENCFLRVETGFCFMMGLCLLCMVTKIVGPLTEATKPEAPRYSR